MHLREDDLSGPEVTSLLREHLDDMYAITPAESVHALNLEGLRAADITFWTAWEGRELLGCGALKALDAHSGEVKSMRTAIAYRGRGVAQTILSEIERTARARAYELLYLETGSMAEFRPARTLYEKAGFVYCGPFGDYRPDPNSVFMRKRL
ncbi:MAG: GNAT family N-acetyltransferase [Pseudomonadales bacterium]